MAIIQSQFFLPSGVNAQDNADSALSNSLVDYAYIVSVNGELHDAEFESIIQGVATGLRFLQQRRPKEMGGRSGSGMVPEPKFIPRIMLQTEGIDREIPGDV